MRHDSNGRQVGQIDRPAVVVPAPGCAKTFTLRIAKRCLSAEWISRCGPIFTSGRERCQQTGQQWLFRLPGVPKPSHLESQNGVYQRNEFPGASRFSHLGGKPPLFNDGFAVRALHKCGCSAAYDISCSQLVYNHLYMSPLEKVVFEKNLCPADTSVRGKKWQRALFQVCSYFNDYLPHKRYFF